jgi:hypothetical protein
MKKPDTRKFLFSTLICIVLILPFVFFKTAGSQVTLVTILIQPDGSVYPASAPIQQNGNIYTFTDNIYAAIKIQKSNIVLDGAGYTLSGPYNGTQTDIFIPGNGPDQTNGTTVQYVIGVDLSGKDVQGTTVENLNIKNFSVGMYMWTKNNTVIGNAVSNCIVGILLSGSNTTITENFIANNLRGLFFGFTSQGESVPADISVSRNAFENNAVQFNGCQCKTYNASEPPHNWNNGKVGNFWSDYHGVDSNHDGIGDTSYVIDAVNQDRYPLMQNPTQPLFHSNAAPIETTIILAVSVATVLSFAILAFQRSRKMDKSEAFP